MNRTPAEPLWYKDAIIYELHVRAFADSNGDGIGDFPGLISRLDYLQQLGVNTIWLLPFYPSPLRDGGYDISDYTSINPDYGTVRDFSRFVREAHRRGLRVITELVVNHTSDQHPWFQRARRAPRGSPERNWYVWSDDDGRFAGTRIIFTDSETSNWAWDPVAGQYYWHRFFSHQPDLNYEHPQVRRAILRVMKFWLDRGVDGLRLDAVPYLREREGTSNENLPETHAVLREWRAFIDEHYADRLLLAEANQWPQDVRAYFGDGDECHMAFHFPVMPRIFMALRQEDRRPIVDILAQTPEIPETCQWALFLRNHDELTLEMVTDEERDYMYSIYATDPRTRLNLGIRRRLAPLVDNNRRAIELLHSLLFSLPGTPILYYGDEIGMGDNVFLGDRDGVRTPMQWSGDRNAGFSRADPALLYLPLIADPLYGYQAVNVESQERSVSSLLNWMRRMIALRARRKALGRGSLEMLHPENRAVLAFVRRHEDAVTLVVANLSRFVQSAALDLSDYAGAVPVEVIGQHALPSIETQPYVLTIGPHGFYWFDLIAQPALEPGDRALDAPRLELRGTDWRRVLEGETRIALEQQAVPAYLGRQRWHSGSEVPAVHLQHIVALRDSAAAPAWVALASPDDATPPATLILAVASGRGARDLVAAHPESVIARVRSDRGDGVLFDGTASDSLMRELVDVMAERRTVTSGDTRVMGERLRPFGPLYEALDELPAVTRSTGEQSNTSVRIGQHLMLKVLRRFEPEPHPETEVGRHLAGTGAPVASLAGVVQLETPTARGPLAVAHEFVWARGDGWTLTVDGCIRFLDDHIGAPPPDGGGSGPMEYAEHLPSLGEATADLHLALADARGNPAFEPELLTSHDLAALITSCRDRLQAQREWLVFVTQDGGSTHAPQAQAVLRLLDGLHRLAGEAPPMIDGVNKIRIHGDYHLGQVLEVEGRYIIVDFEGPVGHDIDERRRKNSVFRDLAGMVRSISYAALTARENRLLTLPEGEQSRDRLTAWMAWWERGAVGALLEAYFARAGEPAFLPRSPGEVRALLDLYLLDTAIHELEYERQFRPEWVTIPLEGLAELAERFARRGGADG